MPRTGQNPRDCNILQKTWSRTVLCEQYPYVLPLLGWQRTDQIRRRERTSEDDKVLPWGVWGWRFEVKQ
jgi:hypothetical protein